MVLALDLEHVQDVLLAAQLALELLAIDSEELLIVDHRRIWLMLLRLLRLMLVLGIWKLAGGVLGGRPHPLVGRHIPDLVRKCRIFITTRIS